MSNAAFEARSPRAALRELAAAILAYAVGVAAVAAAIPALLTPLPIERIAPHPKVIARTPVAADFHPEPLP